jgi:hypothetical protein
VREPRVRRVLLHSAVSAAACLLALSVCAPAFAQNESRVASDFRREGAELKKCGEFTLPNLATCAETLFTGAPVHIAVGSLAPQNGLGAGVAFVEDKHFTDEWQINEDLDAVATTNASWRAGGYLRAFRQPGGTIHVVIPKPGSPAPKKNSTPSLYRVAPIHSLYAQAISLNKLYYYGPGPNSTLLGRSVFGLTETIAGASAIIPLAGKANLALIGEVNGRFPSVRGNHGESSPSVEQLYTEATAPGLTSQPPFFQAGEGLRFKPSFGFLRLNYLVNFSQFVAPGNSQYSFRRWTTDLGHEIPLYHSVRLTSNDRYGPDTCSDSASEPCPRISLSRNLEGSIGGRLLITESIADAGSAVPFYFQPTLGGSDIDGTAMLPSYADYRFRAPNLLLLRGTFEHSIGKLPLGFLFSVDEGKVASRRDDVDFSHMRHSFSTGITVHAGGLPVIQLLFAWGGEGHHGIADVDPALLGASPRPSLF